MQPDPSTLEALRGSLLEAVARWSTDASIDAVAPSRLMTFAPTTARPATAAPPAVAWRLSAPGRVARHLVLTTLSPPFDQAFEALLTAAAMLSSHLDDAEQLEMTAVLILPAHLAHLESEARRLERNRFYARVLLWPLAPTPSEVPDATALLVRRLNLDPVLEPRDATPTDLSPVDQAFATADLSPHVQATWRDLLLGDLNTSDLVEQLLETHTPPEESSDGR